MCATKAVHGHASVCLVEEVSRFPSTLEFLLIFSKAFQGCRTGMDSGQKERTFSALETGLEIKACEAFTIISAGAEASLDT